MQRNIHFGNILKKLDDLKKGQHEQAIYPFLLSLESRLKAIDNDVTAFFSNPTLVTELSKLERDEKFVKQFHDEYAALSRQIGEIGKRFKEEAIGCGAKEIEKIADDLITISKFIPTLKKAQAEQLVFLCTALGGIYLHLSQNELPTAGAKVNKEGKVAKSGGICGGLTLAWAEQSATLGTPNYPITSNVKSLNNQEEYFTLIDKNYTKGNKIPTTNLDVIKKVSELDNNSIYYIHIADPKKSHALGIRKQKNHIEIYDPNYGHYFFREEKCAGSWLSALLEYYQSVNFPCETIEFRKNKASENRQIPDSEYPSDHMLNAVAYLPHTEKGYQCLIASYRHHISLLSLYASDDKKSRLILSAIQTLSAHLSLDDLEKIIEILESCHLGNDFHESYSKFIDKEVYDNIKSKDEIKETITFLQSHHQERKTIPADVQETVKKVNQYILDAGQKYFQIIEDLKTKRSDENQNPREIKELVVKKEILKSRLETILKNNIEAKLLAAINNQLPAFRVTDAEKLLKQAKPDSIQSVLSDEELSKLISFIGKIDYLREGFHALIKSLDQKDYPYDLLNNVRLEKIVSYKKEVIKKKIESLDQLNKNALNGISLTSLLNDANDIHPDFENLPTHKPYLDYSLTAEKLDAFLSAGIKPKYLNNELLQLFNFYKHISDDPTSIKNTLTREKEKKLSETQVEIIRNLENKIHQLRRLFHDAVDPSKPRVYDVSFFAESVRTLSPSSIDTHGKQLSPHSFVIHYLHTDMPQQVMGLITQLKEAAEGPLAADFYGDLYSKVSTIKQFLDNKKTTLEDFMASLKQELKIPNQIEVVDISIDMIKDKIEANKFHYFHHVTSLRNKINSDNNRRAAKRFEYIDSLVSLIENETFWKDKVSVLNLKKAPDGVLKMREELASYKQNANSIDIDQYYQGIAAILTRISTERLNSTKQACFFSSRRHGTTSDLYKVCKHADNILDAQKNAGYLNNDACTRLQANFSNDRAQKKPNKIWPPLNL